MSQQPAQPRDLDAIEDCAAALYEFATVADPEGQAALDQLAGTDVPALIDELRRLRTELATAHSQAWTEAADRLTRKYGFTNRAAGHLRQWATEAHTAALPAAGVAHVVADDTDTPEHTGARPGSETDGMPAHEIWSPHCENGCCR